ncbi:PAS domain-containing protein [Hymenobacter sp. NBH84]|uniref:PAS domain-containing sensor histidine kinase n=1 Tax=Hymenobacter sp. NBH84 TaxID=2596915 RepID=UPI001625812B|nr:ATP-binding protein [Hymenobacter sp. NBH84]QNE40055.1 PAS domain-containing protein [Hymenobacter sp. NBH84]
MINPSAFLQTMVEEMPHFFFIYQVNTKQVVYATPACEQLLGVGPAQATEQLPELLSRLHPDDQPYLARCWNLWVRGHLHDELEFRVRRTEVPDQWMSLVLSPHQQRLADGEVLIGGFLRDVTTERDNLENANRFNAKKNATLEILSHDLAGPLALVQQISAAMQAQVLPLGNAKLTEALSIMQTICHDSVNLIRDFVDNEFMTSANVELKLDRVDLVWRVNLTMEEYQRAAAQLNKQFLFLPASAPIYVNLDENKFLQVLNNLLSNSIKFTHEGGHITVRIEQQPGQVLLTVQDDGIGIAPELQPGLFERFTKARRPGLRGEKTTGLGMSIIKTIVELHRGQIWLESAENQGTTFYITLPSLDS